MNEISIEYRESEGRIYLSSPVETEFEAVVLDESGKSIYSLNVSLTPGNFIWIETSPSLTTYERFSVEARHILANKQFIKESTPLCEIMKKYGSDKSTWHNYTKTYHKLFSEFTGKNISVFEMGLGTNNTNLVSNMGANGKPGASLRAWSEYFPYADVFGADIDHNTLFEEDRIKTFWCDQTNTNSIESMWENDVLKGRDMDIIIDDGLHEYHANLIFFEASISRLKPGGIFVIEDLTEETAQKFRESIPILQEWYSCTMEILDLPYAGNYGNDNRLLIARF